MICDWSAPGIDRYLGDVPAAVESYADIPPAIRQRLRERMERHAYDDVATITRDTIHGAHGYSPELRGMHFGSRGRTCDPDRSRWADGMAVQGLVYCEESHCLIVPSPCGNVARVERLPDEPPAAVAPPVAPDEPTSAPDEPVDITAPPEQPDAPTGQETEPGEPTFEGGSHPPTWFGLPPLLAGIPVPPRCECCDEHAPPPAVPEPSTWALLLGGLAWIAGRKWRRA